MTIKFIDMFGGIGGFRHGIQNAIPEAECAAYYEIDEFAVDSYNAIFDENHEPTDVTELEPREVPDHSIICGGFPCQAFSMAGKRRGFADPRGTLFYEILRIAKAKRTPYLFLENVRGLLSHDGGRTFGTILKSLHDAGYDAQWEVLNSKNFGVPQNRERIFIIAHLRGESRPEVFPLGRENREDSGSDGCSELSSGEGVSHAVDANYFKGTSPGDMGNGRRTHIINHQERPETRPSVSEEGQSGGSGLLYNSEYSYELSKSPHYVKESSGQIEAVGNIFDSEHGDGRVFDKKGISPTLLSNIRKSQKTISPKIVERQQIRRLTPRECWRLQGFPDSSFEAAQAVNSDTQLYKQVGKAVTVNVIQAIMEAWRPYLVNDETEHTQPVEAAC